MSGRAQLSSMTWISSLVMSRHQWSLQRSSNHLARLTEAPRLTGSIAHQLEQAQSEGIEVVSVLVGGATLDFPGMRTLSAASEVELVRLLENSLPYIGGSTFILTDTSAAARAKLNPSQTKAEAIHAALTRFLSVAFGHSHRPVRPALASHLRYATHRFNEPVSS
jgi:hypothetical protein